MPVSGFFTTRGTQKIKSVRHVPTVGDVGRDGDSLFRSIAAALIDQFLRHPHLYTDSLNQLLRRHFEYFPAHKPTSQRLLTKQEVIQMVLARVEKPELIQALAFTLRQMTVDKMLKQPLQFPQAFITPQGSLPPALMRKPGVRIDECCIGASAQAIGARIEVRHRIPGKEIAMPMSAYHPRHSSLVKTPPWLRLVEENNRYAPELSNPDGFRSTRYDNGLSIGPVNRTGEEPQTGHVLIDIETREKELDATFTSIYQRLNAMVNAGELTADHLVTLYSKQLDMNANGTALDTSYFVNRLQAAYPHPGHHATNAGSDRVSELAYSLALKMSVDEQFAEVAFTFIEGLHPQRHNLG